MIKMRADINTDVNNLFYCIFVYLNVSTVSQLGVNTLVSYETVILQAVIILLKSTSSNFFGQHKSIIFPK